MKLIAKVFLNGIILFWINKYILNVLNFSSQCKASVTQAWRPVGNQYIIWGGDI